MIDIEALEAAGFAKTMTVEEWEANQVVVAQRYVRDSGATTTPEAGSQVSVDYVLERGDVRITVEQNTQDQAPFGIQTTVRYPQIAVLEHVEDWRRRVAVDASDTELILLLADQLGEAEVGNPKLAEPPRPGRGQ